MLSFRLFSLVLVFTSTSSFSAVGKPRAIVTNPAAKSPLFVQTAHSPIHSEWNSTDKNDSEDTLQFFDVALGLQLGLRDFGKNSPDLLKNAGVNASTNVSNAIVAVSNAILAVAKAFLVLTSAVIVLFCKW